MKYFLSFRNAIIRSGTIDEIKKAIEKIFRQGKDNLARYLENAVMEVLGDGILGGRLLSKLEIENWAKILKDKYGTTLRKVDKFENKGVLANFDPNTNSINYMEGVTEYIMAHESYHAMEMSIKGFDDYVKGGALKGTVYPEGYTAANFINMYNREKFVFDQLMKNTTKHGLNARELWHAKDYLKAIEYDMSIAGVAIPK